MVMIKINNDPTITVLLKRKAILTIGSYSLISKRLTGFFASGLISPLINRVIKAGVIVIARSAAKNIENVLVNASGLLTDSCGRRRSFGPPRRVFR